MVPLFIRIIADGLSPTIFGDGTQTRDYTFVDNVVEANLRAAERSVPSGTVINIGSGERTSTNELSKTLNEILGAQKEPTYAPELETGIKHFPADTKLSNELLGDYNVTPLRDGLVHTARWFLKNSGRTQRYE